LSKMLNTITQKLSSFVGIDIFFVTLKYNKNLFM